MFVSLFKHLVKTISCHSVRFFFLRSFKFYLIFVSKSIESFFYKVLWSFILEGIIGEKVNMGCFSFATVIGVADFPLVDNAFLRFELNFVVFDDGIDAVLTVAE